MLDLFKLQKQVSKSASYFFTNQSEQLRIAKELWQAICQDENFKRQIEQVDIPFSIPSWEGNPGICVQLDHKKINYVVVASDGSQIYPDRHMGTNCYLINTGVSTLRYNTTSSAKFVTEPYFFTDVNKIEGSVAPYVDSRRHELEIEDGFLAIQKEQAKGAHKIAYLADGSLIAWHLAGKGDALHDRFMPVYLKQLENFYQKKIPFIGYISLPNSKELINLLKVKLMGVIGRSDQTTSLDSLVDADFLLSILKPLQRTAWFKSNVAAADLFSKQLAPHFCYLNVGGEIARIELPAWILQDQESLDLSMEIVVDQVQKGRGYPVALAEAHQQAVIKSADRKFFYNLLRQHSLNSEKKVVSSRKVKQKQIMGI